MMNGSYLAWAEAPQTLDGIGYYSGENQATLTGAGEPMRIAYSRTYAVDDSSCSAFVRCAGASSPRMKAPGVTTISRS